MTFIQTTLGIKQFLLHRYLYNLQRGIDCLTQNHSVKSVDPTNQSYLQVIELPFCMGHEPLTVYAHSISSPAWNNENENDFPILLSDKGQLMNRLIKQTNFQPIYLNVWQIEICAKFNAILDLQAPEEINYKYDYKNGSDNFNITCLAYYKDLNRQLCSFISFILTVKDVYSMYFQTERE